MNHINWHIGKKWIRRASCEQLRPNRVDTKSISVVSETSCLTWFLLRGYGGVLERFKKNCCAEAATVRMPLYQICSHALIILNLERLPSRRGSSKREHCFFNQTKKMFLFFLFRWQNNSWRRKYVITPFHYPSFFSKKKRNSSQKCAQR